MTGGPFGAEGRFGADYRWLLVGRGVDSLGNAMHPIALGFAVLALFESVTALGLVVGSAMLGHVLFVLVGGVVADRLPRTVVLVVSNVAAAVLQGGVVLVVVAQWEALWLLVGLSFLTGATAAFDGPASTALVPQTLAVDQLRRGNSWLLLVRRAGFLVGSSLGGLVVAVAGAEMALAVNAATFLVAGFCFWRVRVPQAPGRGESSRLVRDLVEGWDEFRARTWLWLVVAAFFVINACWFGGFRILGLAIAEDSFGPAAWGVVIGSEGVGALAAGVALAGDRRLGRPLVWGMLGSMVGVGPLIALAGGAGAATLIVLGVLGGVGMMVFGITWETALHQHVPADRLARVSSFDHLGSFAAMPIGGFVAGPLSDAFGVLTVIRGAAVLSVVACLVPLASRQLRDLAEVGSAEVGQEPGQA